LAALEEKESEEKETAMIGEAKPEGGDKVVVCAPRSEMLEVREVFKGKDEDRGVQVRYQVELTLA